MGHQQIGIGCISGLCRHAVSKARQAADDRERGYQNPPGTHPGQRFKQVDFRQHQPVVSGRNCFGGPLFFADNMRFAPGCAQPLIYGDRIFTSGLRYPCFRSEVTQRIH